jgi:hypothetical protein
METYKRIGLSLLILVLSLCSAGAYYWTIETVDSVGSIGEFSSIALDSQGHPHISYYDHNRANLLYAFFDGNVWFYDTVDTAGDVGRYCDIAIAADGYPHISYLDNTNERLMYGFYNGSTWTIEVADSSPGVGQYTSIAFDTSGTVPYISYYDFNNEDLKMANKPGGTWTQTRIDSSVTAGLYTSIAIGSDNFPRISYYNDSPSLRDLRFALYDGASWTVEVADGATKTGSHTSLILDGADNPHISYYFHNTLTLMYATKVGPSWSQQTVDSSGNTGEYTSIAFNNLGNPIISYYDVGNTQLKFAEYNGATWNSEIVDIINVGPHTSCAVYANSRIYISYYDMGQTNLKLAVTAMGDSIPPGPPQNLTANGSNPSPWTNNPLFTINWTNPPDTSGISRSLYKLGTPPTGDFDTTGTMKGTPPDYAQTSAEGGETLYLWLQDFAGNLDYQNYSTVELRYDSTPPTGSDASSPLYSTTLDFLVDWTAGIDSGGAGISGYDIKVKDGAGSWIDWLSNYNGLNSTYTGTDGHVYYFESSARDSAGNIEIFTGIPECSTKVDTTKPTVASTYPLNGATGIAVNSNVSATFSEEMDSTTILSSYFSIVGSGSGNHTFSLNYDPLSFTVDLDPDINFHNSENVTVTIQNNVTDLAGNMMATDFSWSFSTGTSSDTVGPITYSANASPNPTEPIAFVTISATVSDVGYGFNAITEAEFFVDSPGGNGTGYDMEPVDSAWGDTTENVKGTLDTEPLTWAPNDTHPVFIHGKDNAGNWGTFDTVMVVVEPDDDTTGPTFSDFKPSDKPDTVTFYIECRIFDPEGVYDDSTGSSGQGVYLLWDNDGEISVDAYEETMWNTTGEYYRTDSLIPVQNTGVNFVYQVYAYDNDFDTQHPGDRTQDSSGIQTILITDNRGPRTMNLFASPNPTYGDSQLVISALITDSLRGNSPISGAEFFVDDTTGTGTAMSPLDGLFDEISEDVIDTLDISSWVYGTQRWIFIHGEDSSGNWGRFDSILIDVRGPQDTIPPYITSTSPDSGEVNVNLNRNVFITFSEPMDTFSFDTSAFHISGSTNPVYTYVLSYDPVTFTVQLNPDSLFEVSEVITIDVDSTVSDTFGNPMTNPYQFSFTTGSSLDTIGPLVISRTVYPDTTQGAHYCSMMGTISDSTTGMSEIYGAETFIDTIGPNGTGQPMQPSDGGWNEIVEDVNSTIDISSLSLGTHWVFIHGCDNSDNWGLFDSIQIFVTPDDDTLGPSFSGFLPDSAPDTTSFHIYCEITDPSGVFDDTSGSLGQGVYILWDNDGEISIDNYEREMSLFSGDTFRTDIPIPQQSKNANFVYEVYAFDNDFDFNEPEDRTQGQSGIQNIIIFDSRGPITSYPYISPPNPPAGITQIVAYATISDSQVGASLISGAEVFLDSVGSTGTGFSMQAVDGAFDSLKEDVLDTIPVSGWQAGDTHTIYVHGLDEYGNWGEFDSASVFVTAGIDTFPPWIAFTIPDSGDTGISINAWIYITFTEKIDPVTLTNDKILIDGNIGGTYNFWMSYNDADSTASINPLTDFAPFESVDVYIASGIQDLSGNIMTSNFWWWFRTGPGPDTTRPVVDSIGVEPDTLVTTNYTYLTGAISDNREVMDGEYFIDSIGINGTGYPVFPIDSFGTPSVDVFDTIYTDTLSFGSHSVYLHGIDGSGNWSLFDSVSFYKGGDDTIGPQFTITVTPSPASIGDSLTIRAVPTEPLHPDSAVLCSITTDDGSIFTLNLSNDSLSYSNSLSSVGFTDGICTVGVSGYDLWSNWGTSDTTFLISPSGEFLPEKSVYAWPNPARGNSIHFHFYVNANADITIDIFNLEGKLVRTLSGTGQGGNPPHLQSSNSIVWNISPISSDIYLFRIRATSRATGEVKSVIKKFAIVK